MQPGEWIGPYQVEDRLGAGQMGVVYAVRRPDLDARYALKTLRRELCSARDLLRFQREVEHLARVSAHPNVVPIHTAGEHKGGLYYVMDLVEGETLQGLLDKGGPLAPERAARYVRDLAGALAALHRAGVVHRDLKPANVLVDRRMDSARLTDFGLARTFADDGGRLTVTGELVGTPQFMAPEQALGHPVGPPADVYALGMVLFTLLAGRPAVVSGGKGMIALLSKVGSGELEPLPRLAPDAPSALVELVGACLALDPATRPEAAAVRRELDAYLAAPGRGAPARPGGLRFLAAAAGAAALLGGAALAVTASRRPGEGEAAAATAAIATRDRTRLTTARPAAPAWLPRLLNAPGDLDLLERACAELDQARETRALDAAALERLHEALAAFEVRWSPPEPSRLLALPDGRERAARDVQMLVALYELLRRLDPSSRAPSPARRQHLTDLVAIAGGAENRIGPDTYRRLADLAPDFLPVYVGYNAVSKAVPTLAQLEQDVAMLRRGLAAAEALARAGEGPEHMVEDTWNTLARGLTTRITRMADAAPGHDKPARAELARAALPFAVEHAERVRARRAEGPIAVTARAAAEPWTVVAELHQRLGQHDDAAAALDAGAALDPALAAIPARRALFLLEVSPDDPRALGLAREALELARSDAAAREHRGIIMHACRRTAAASASHDPAGVIAVCEEALRIFRDEAYPSLAVYPLVLEVRRADVPTPRLALLLGDVAQRLERYVADVTRFLKDERLPEAPVHAQWTSLVVALRAWGEQAREGIAPPGDALREALAALEYFVSSGLLP